MVSKFTRKRGLSVLTLIVFFVSIFMSFGVNVGATTSAFQTVLIEAMDLSSSDRDGFISNVLVVLENDAGKLTELVSVTKSAYLKNMLETDIQVALEKYASFSSSSTTRTGIKAAITTGLVATDPNSISGSFPGIASKLNEEVTGDPNDFRGVGFVVSVLKTGCDIINAPVAFDVEEGSTVTKKVYFELPAGNTMANLLDPMMSDLIQNSVEAVKERIDTNLYGAAYNTGDSYFAKFLKYVGAEVNNPDNSRDPNDSNVATITSAEGDEVAAFKTFLNENKGNANIYQASASAPVITGDPLTLTVGTRLGITGKGDGPQNAKLPFSVNYSTITNGITGYSFDVVYDPTKVTPTGIVAYTSDKKNGIANGTVVGSSEAQMGQIVSINSTSSKVTVSWTGTLAANPATTNAGTLLKVNFLVSEGLTSGTETAVTVTNPVFTLASGQSNNVTVVSGKVKYGLYGDINVDGVVNAVDAGQMVRKGLGKTNIIDGTSGATLTAEMIELRRMAADINYDGVVNAVDAGQAVRKGLGKSHIICN